MKTIHYRNLAEKDTAIKAVNVAGDSVIHDNFLIGRDGTQYGDLIVAEGLDLPASLDWRKQWAAADTAEKKLHVLGKVLKVE